MSKHRDWLFEWFFKRNPDSKFKTDENFFHKELIDSLGIIELVEDIEKIFKIEFTSNDFQDSRFTSINGLTEIIEEKKNN